MTQTTLTPQPHAALIKAWADGAQIEFRGASDPDGPWRSCRRPTWRASTQYRVKPREFWINRYAAGADGALFAHTTVADADAHRTHDCIERIRVREVVE